MHNKNEIKNELLKILKKIMKRKRSTWIRKWICRRNRLGASGTLLKELALEDNAAHKNHLRGGSGLEPKKIGDI